MEEKFEVWLNLVYFFALKQCNQKKKKSIFVCLVAEKVREIGGRSLNLNSIWLSSILCARLLKKYGKLEQKFKSGSI